jgi:ATP-dependent DNA helicase RecG
MQLTDIKGIGDAYLKKLNALGIFSVNDLADFLPNGYIDFRSYTPTEEIEVGKYIFVKGEVVKSEFNSRKGVVKAVLSVADAEITDEKGKKINESANETNEKTDEISGNENEKTDGTTDEINKKADEKTNEANGNANEKIGKNDKIKEKTSGKTIGKGVILSAFWFNQPYIKDKIKAGEYIFFGKASEFDGKISLSNPIFESAEAPKTLKGIMPIYRTKGLISQGTMRKFLTNAFEYCRFEGVSEYSVENNTIKNAQKNAENAVKNTENNTENTSKNAENNTENEEKNTINIEKNAQKSVENDEKNVKNNAENDEKNAEKNAPNDAMTLNQAYKKAHFPLGIDEAKSAQRRLAREDFVKLIFTYKLLKSRNARRGQSFADIGILKNYLSALPFALTNSQKNALDEVLSDMTSPSYMNRLLMGDVGSGKTAIAFAAAYFAAKSGVQTAFLAPTELLARQHYKTASSLFSSLDVRVKFLAASASPAEKKDAQNALNDGSADIVIGTHSLFSAGVKYKNLGLIVVDEQHKFGVSEKNALKEKSENADVLALSATPIPRALSLALLGELDVSTIERRNKIDDMIATRIVPERKKNDMFEYIKRQAEEGRQAYIVASRIEDAEGIEVDTVKNLYRELKDGIFKDINVAVLHGKTGKAEKERIMNEFQSGEIKILIGTTVVEVGIDVKNADIMAVMNADGYGLSTLHQLRGRVGRGERRSYCFLHTAKEDNPRLKALLECADGFLVAERDFELRGGGNFLGERQSGGFERLNNYIVDIDKELIAEAKKIAENIPLNEETERAFREMNYQKYYNVIKNTVLM